jgi:hypothetical protein
MADHIEPHRGDVTRVPTRTTPLSLCADCHDALDGTNRRRAPIRADGTPSDPHNPWNASAQAQAPT